ncbi:hypothetical protein DC365_23960 [Vibrio vulnificus]|uniref:hypothetical protein n=1 Tax=Vibrio vulnificus TaxID=672 RepID=UPI000D3E7BC4|nr:hypothetical protein [Vibrio vulnificus]ELH3008334.1 hypothetical protein [Vibrio vulnificus]ELK8330127.1 hypothetical protein [Vibrio vulnificus]ELN6898831.1 hypothetical protein [Vibrio vulnificus]ELU0083198.1 hypothetical protein [Vibrio vulnificus]ELV8644254.1 hypothetical protein [Vibrio vulnificus]
MKSLILALTLFSMTVCFSQAAELHLSNSVVMDLTLPKEASHSSNLLILKFDDWHFSHEVIDPKTFFRPVDLTDIQHHFLKSVFYPNLRDNFPSWLRELSNELAVSFGLPKSQVIDGKFDNFELIGSYDSISKQGYLFIFEEHQIHHISYFGEKEHYLNMTNTIKEK